MKVKHSRVLTILTSIFFVGACHSGQARDASLPSAIADERIKAEARVSDATAVLAEIAGSDDARKIPLAATQNAECVAVVPSLLEGALIVGAKSGKGVVTCRANGGWSAPAFFTITGGTVGFQIGGRSADILMLLNSDHAKRSLLAGDLRIGGEVSATAGPVGRGRAAETDPTLHAEILSYSRGRGLFAGVDLSGVGVHSDSDANRAYYGGTPSLSDVLARPAPEGPPASQFIVRVSEVFGTPPGSATPPTPPPANASTPTGKTAEPTGASAGP
jgi:lipid-binding SYLF domain-containing protein